MEDQHRAFGDGLFQRSGRIRYAVLGERLLQHRGLQRGVPLQPGLGQQPAHQGGGAALVPGARLGAEQGPGEAVGLGRTYGGERQQPPRVLAELPGGVLAQRRRGGAGQCLGGATAGQYGPYALDGVGGGRGHRRRGGGAWCRGLGGGLAGRGGSLVEVHGGLRTALHGPYGGQQVGGLPAELRPGLDGRLPLGLAPGDPLPLDLLGGQLRLGLAEGGRRLGLGGRLDGVLGAGAGLGFSPGAVRPGFSPGALRPGLRLRGPCLVGSVLVRVGRRGLGGRFLGGSGLGLAVRTHSVLQS